MVLLSENKSEAALRSEKCDNKSTNKIYLCNLLVLNANMRLMAMRLRG